MRKTLFGLLFSALLAALLVYGLMYRGNINRDIVLKVYPNASFQEVVDSMQAQGLQSAFTFKLASWLYGYPSLVKPGRYKLAAHTNNKSLIAKLRAGNQDPLLVVVPSKRDIPSVAAVVAQQLAVDSGAIVQAFLAKARERKIDEVAYPCQWIPNSYEMYWTVSPQDLVQRLEKERARFWEELGSKRLANTGLTACEVVTLASIVQKETAKKDEMPRVAGVYLNRLEKGMRLQADPTLVYLLSKENNPIRRVVNADKKIDSPYNTYKVYGLPPGPICVPEITAIKAVLNAEKHNYLYFCAKEDFSGYHAFAKTYSAHLQNARRYQRELNKRKIYR